MIAKSLALPLLLTVGACANVPMADPQADQAGKQRLSNDQEEHFSGCDAQAAQDSEELSPLDNGESHCVIDEEHPDHQSQQAQGSEIKSKS